MRGRRASRALRRRPEAMFFAPFIRRAPTARLRQVAIARGALSVRHRARGSVMDVQHPAGVVEQDGATGHVAGESSATDRVGRAVESRQESVKTGTLVRVAFEIRLDSAADEGAAGRQSSPRKREEGETASERRRGRCSAGSARSAHRALTMT